MADRKKEALAVVTDRQLAELAHAAYSAPADFIGPPGPCEDAHVCLTCLEEMDILAARGTGHDGFDVLLDVLHDVDARSVGDADLIQAHEGFLSLALAVFDPIFAAIEHRARPVMLTGHSLGGAMALAIGGKLLARGKLPAAIVTFGAPRLGISSAYRSVFAGIEIRQYRNGNDPIPDMPPEWLGYKHVRDLTIIGATRAIPIEAHFIERYIEVLPS